jgi:hypothetical protein
MKNKTLPIEGAKDITRTKKDYQLIGRGTNSIAIGTMIRRTQETIAIKKEKLKTLEREHQLALDREYKLGIHYREGIEFTLEEIKKFAENMYVAGRNKKDFEETYKTLIDTAI